MITYLNASSNNKAETGFNLFKNAVSEFGILSHVHSNMGREKIDFAKYNMLEHCGLNRGSVLVGRSVHNQRIERLWRDVLVIFGLQKINPKMPGQQVYVHVPAHMCTVHIKKRGECAKGNCMHERIVRSGHILTEQYTLKPVQMLGLAYTSYVHINQPVHCTFQFSTTGHLG